jgi:8-oxo-dGTP diphosphatase
MELINEIYNKDVTGEQTVTPIAYNLRKASRSIVSNKNHQIALLYVSKHKYHKLPGGGVENAENIKETLKREVIEEVGVHVVIGDEIGAIIEYRDEFNLLQISYCFFSKVIGEITTPTFTESELINGFQLKWVTLDEAITLLSNDSPDDYMGKFIKKRDLGFLNRAKEMNY